MIKINLLSTKKKDISSSMGETASFVDEERESKVNVVAIVASLVLTVGVIAFLYFSQTALLEKTEKTLQTRKLVLKEKEPILKKIDQLEKTRNLLIQKVMVIEGLKNQQGRTVKMMDQLSNSLPEWVWLTRLRFSGNTLSLNGRTLTNSLIADFINRLKASNYFTNIIFHSSSRKTHLGQEILDFRLTCTYKGNVLNKKVG